MKTIQILWSSEKHVFVILNHTTNNSCMWLLSQPFQVYAIQISSKARVLIYTSAVFVFSFIFAILTDKLTIPICFKKQIKNDQRYDI